MPKVATIRLAFKKPGAPKMSFGSGLRGYYSRQAAPPGLRGYYKNLPGSRPPLPVPGFAGVRGLGPKGPLRESDLIVSGPFIPDNRPIPTKLPVGLVPRPLRAVGPEPARPDLSSLNAQFYSGPVAPAPASIEQVAAQGVPSAPSVAGITSWFGGSTTILGYTVKNLYLALGAGAAGVFLLMRSKGRR